MTKLNDSFTDYIVNDQLASLHIRARKMFGGVGLYAGTIFFGLISKDELYFKVDNHSREKYLQAGQKPFQPNDKQILKSYYQVPADIIENQDKLVEWAKEAIQHARQLSSPINSQNI